MIKSRCDGNDQCAGRYLCALNPAANSEASAMQTATPGLVLRCNPGTTVIPGEHAATLEAQPQTEGKKRTVVRLGVGLYQSETDLYISKAGTLRFDHRRSKLWVDENQKRYYPRVQEAVLGIVTEKYGEEYRIDLGATETAILPALAFEGASKRNRPNLSIGALVYCRITEASKDWEVAVSCIEPGSSKSWVTGETFYGELKGGTVMKVPLPVAKCLMNHDNPFLTYLGSKIAFESAVGLNGRVWINATNVARTVVVTSALSKVGFLSFKEWKMLVNRLLNKSS